MKTTKRKSKTAGKTATPAEATLQAAAPERVLALSSHCTIKDAAALQGDLRALANEPVVTLDVGSVERIDTATMQLIYAFARDRAQREQKILWKGESQSWRDAVRLLGAGALLVEGAQS